MKEYFEDITLRPQPRDGRVWDKAVYLRNDQKVGKPQAFMSIWIMLRRLHDSYHRDPELMRFSCGAYGIWEWVKKKVHKFLFVH